MWLTVIALGLAGGIVSTIVGFGGGMILAIALALTVSPLAALAVSSVALLSGSLHRIMLYRHELERADAYRWALAICVGGIVGGTLAHHIPTTLLRIAFVVAAMGTLLMQRNKPREPTSPPRAPRAAVLVPVGGAIGFVGAATAGVGPIASSTLLATGHAGERYIALMAVTGAALNTGRVLGYGTSGTLQISWLWASGLAAIGLLAGNLAGKRIRRSLRKQTLALVERAVPFGVLALAIAGLFR